MRLVDLGKDIWLGDLHACDERSSEFPHVIHCWRDQHFEHHSCDHVRERRRAGLPMNSVEYTDDGGLLIKCVELQELPVGVPHQLAAYVRNNTGPIFIHCAAGENRSPTLAVLALVARGMAMDEALCAVWRAVRSYGGVLFTNFMLDNVAEWHAADVMTRPKPAKS